ncbi:hypothetical protein [Iamia sp.]|uniref:hypothetical protein n=1 Tax=Iamia sp. TaxID=2722710 RepID=UPI002C7668D4|nr:hypothetical protein [Iamia sp.]HXH57505.1 hypothetical protein [Iamia sp.]
MRVLHVSDLHLNPQAFALIERVVDQFGVEVVADTGDINDWGTTFETSGGPRREGAPRPRRPHPPARPGRAGR